ncbi:hypothetical protein SAMN04488008_10250 [Maribacter orientalis]|uniref:Uncharacterized protein n=1 Tax=Maribacter orientalis TaxID=228957 RepID=A0A1H7JFB3_9FLAO|nr:DUF6090 family protein [Maribacter orientalis]SEK73341.1 hypothetical protein SAMN04488008_10250 [Maribacter orientalis]
MIKLFRTIRQNLLSEGKTGKYLKYAIGEIILVVIGILIALQINDWNENRINRKQEHQILLQLKSEYTENLNELDNKITMRNNTIDASYRIFSVKEGLNENVPVDSIALDLITINSTPTFDPVTGTTNEVLSSGKLYLLTNDMLKTLLTNWSGQVNRLTEYEQDLRNYSINHFYPYLTKNHNIKLLFNGLWWIDKFNFKNKDKRIAVTKIIEDDDIDDYILTITEQCGITNNEAVHVRNNIESILQLINADLDKK